MNWFQKNSWIKNFAALLLMAIGTQILLTGYTDKHQRRVKQSNPNRSQWVGDLRTCTSQSFFTVSTKKGTRNLIVCSDANCQDESIRIKLNKRALWEIANTLRYSRRSLDTTLISTMLNLNSRASGFMINQGVEARILQVKNREVLIGDRIKGKQFSFADGRSIKATGEKWRECNALDSLNNAVRNVLTEIKTKGPKNLSGVKFVERLESELIKAKMRSMRF